jgi:hypothetical protein
MNSGGASLKRPRKYMHDVLQVAVAAHGGLEQCNRLNSVKATMSITGSLWQLKGRPVVLIDVAIEAELHKEKHHESKGL